MNNVLSFIEDLREQKSGFSFGDPIRFEDNSVLCVIPILRKSRKKRGYITIGEADRVRITDTGEIDKLLIINEEDQPVFIRMGELIRGETQERASVMSGIVMPRTKVEIMVVCVHASRGIRAGARMKPMGYAPSKDTIFSEAIFCKRRVNQSRSWAKDAEYVRMVAESAGNLEGRIFHGAAVDDLTAALGTAKNRNDAILDKIPITENEVGITIIDKEGVNSLELFDLHDSWRAVRESLLAKEALVLSEKDAAGLFEFRPDRAHGILRDFLKRKFSPSVAFDNGFTKTVAIDEGGYSGQAVCLEGSVIHLALARKDKKTTDDYHI